ncbi:uncharacterized protein PAC_15105 [Phialocephala subalpina]|uniref:Uncharacterized protein n=1 Tax=Phialocephala subalpina TaxID=576137 RepID=A0A1L7XJH9_9HELO|nr:uncharacterized protein PAC_15105 [Phialocephala subalpina]
MHSLTSHTTFDDEGCQYVNLTALVSDHPAAIESRQTQPIDLHQFQRDADGEIPCYTCPLHQCTIRFTDDTCDVSRVTLFSSLRKAVGGTVVNMRAGQTILDSILPYTVDIDWPTVVTIGDTYRLGERTRL